MIETTIASLYFWNIFNFCGNYNFTPVEFHSKFHLNNFLFDLNYNSMQFIGLINGAAIQIFSPFSPQTQYSSGYISIVYCLYENKS